ncbi:1496_t:CDS:2, partial [Cetraspora pellucida]
SQLPASNPSSSVVYVCEKKESKRGQTIYLSIENLANWLVNPKIKNNPTIINKKVPKTNIEWFNLMKKSFSKWQKKTKVFQPIEEDSEAEFGLTTQVYRKRQRKDQRKETPTSETIDQRNESEKDPKDLANDMFKVDGAEYAFSTWFVKIEFKKYEAKMTKENDSADGKYIKGGPNVILTKKIKPGFWVGIDEKFLVKEVSEQSEVEKLNSNASLKVVDLAKQVFGANHARSQLANKINEWYPISEKINNDIKQACIKHRHGGCWNTPNYHINDIICIDMKECYLAIAVNRKLFQDNITEFAQKQLNQQEEQEPKNRHWELIKDISDSTALSIHDPITKYQKSYLNREEGSAKDFQEKYNVKAQTWHSFFK